MDPNQNREDQIVAFKELLRTYDSYSKKPMDEDTKLSYLETFCSTAPGLNNIPSLTAILTKAMGHFPFNGPPNGGHLTNGPFITKAVLTNNVL
jgi:hypothetical protein